MKRLIIGDIHGCYAELQDLLDKAGLAAEDEIIAVGDIVDRGPESPRVLEFFRTTSRASSLMGNHERKHVSSRRGKVRPALSQLITRRQIGEARYGDACAFMEALPCFLELEEAVLVHGFWEPGVALRDQRQTVIVGTLTGERYLQQKFDRPWYDLYDGRKPLVVGHHDYSGRGEPQVFKDLVFGVDTACCHGRRLTGLVLPDFRFVSVPSRRDYWAEMKRMHADVRHGATSDEDLSWDKAQRLIDSARQQAHLPAEVQQRIRCLSVSDSSVGGTILATSVPSKTLST